VYVYAKYFLANPKGRADQGNGLWSLACWKWGFESPLGLASLSVVSVVCCQVEVPALWCSLIQGISTEVMCLTECDSETPIMRRPWPSRECYAMEKSVFYRVVHEMSYH